MANSLNVANVQLKNDLGHIYFHPFVGIFHYVIIYSVAIINVDVDDDGDDTDDYDFLPFSIIHGDCFSLSASKAISYALPIFMSISLIVSLKVLSSSGF